MVNTIYGGAPVLRNRDVHLSGIPLHHTVENGCARQDRALLAAFDSVEVLSIGEILAAAREHPRPLSAVLRLVDAGALAMDLDGPFNADRKVWRGPTEPQP